MEEVSIHGGISHVCKVNTNNFAVYNVTEYSRDHPGGADALLEVAGQDATSAYEDVRLSLSRAI